MTRSALRNPAVQGLIALGALAGAFAVGHWAGRSDRHEPRAEVSLDASANAPIERTAVAEAKSRDNSSREVAESAPATVRDAKPAEDSVDALLALGTPDAIQKLVELYGTLVNDYRTRDKRAKIIRGLGALPDRRAAEAALRAVAAQETDADVVSREMNVFAGGCLVGVWKLGEDAEAVRQARSDLMTEQNPRVLKALLTGLTLISPEGLGADLASLARRTDDVSVQQGILLNAYRFNDPASALMIYRDAILDPIGTENSRVALALTGIGMTNRLHPEVLPEARSLILGLAARPDLTPSLALEALKSLVAMDPAQVETFAASMKVTSPELEDWLEEFRWRQEKAKKK